MQERIEEKNEPEVGGAVVELLGSVTELMESVIFGGIAKNTIPDYLFRPLGVSMGATTLAAPCVEKDKGKQVLSFLGFLPTTAANVAIWAFEGPTAALIFTCTLGVGTALLTADFAYKIHTAKENEKVTGWDAFQFAVKAGKNAAILLTLNWGGTGKVFELIGSGANASLVSRVSSGIAAGIAGLSGLRGFFRSTVALGKALCCRKDETNYHKMEEGSSVTMSNFGG